MNNKLLILVCASLLIVVQGCKAPRNNINDPLSPDYNFGTLEGVVQSVGIPSVGVPKVKVIWQNANLIAETDITGRYRLTNIPLIDGNIVFSKEGYKPDTLQVVWGTSKRFFTQVFFNRIPTLDSIYVYSSFIFQSGLPPVPSLFVKTWVTDLDDDIDSAFVLNNNISLKKLLSASGAGVFETSISESQLSGINIEETVGFDFSILIKDKFENEFIIGEERVIRVINNEVTGLFPTDDSTIYFSNQPVILNWNQFESGFAFTYRIDVYKIELLNQELIHSVNGIPPATISYTMPFNLSTGNYYWVIWVIDKYQNRSRTKPVQFKIANDPIP